jgi:geranyl-CoA carboxylase beta subunit
MAIVMEEGARRKGAALLERTVADMRARIVETFESQQSAFYTSGRLLDDAVIDPRDTRRVVALALSVCEEAERRALRPSSFGVARM